MAIRNIRRFGDTVLNKKCKTVTEMSTRLEVLIDDMIDTMYEADGVGLAACQVGVLKRVVVVDVSADRNEPIILINPEIIFEEGTQTGDEGCLSLPGKAGIVTRPEHVKVKALNRNLEMVEYEGTGLLARAFCHELDHLEGNLYTEKIEGELHDSVVLEEEQEEEDA